MQPLKRSLPIAFVASVFVLGTCGAHAEGPPATWQGQVAATVNAWATTGNLNALKAGIRDVCSENPGVTLDIIAYAGQVAVSSTSGCALSNPDCPALDDMLGALYDQVFRLSAIPNRSTSGPTTVGSPDPSAGRSSPTTVGSSNPRSAGAGKPPAGSNQLASASGTGPPAVGGKTPKPSAPPTCQSIGLCAPDPRGTSPTTLGR